MNQTSKFEDLIAWQKARALTKAIYEVTRQGDWARDWNLTNQIRSAAVSIMSNIAEGNERSGPSEYAHFLSIAKGSSAEVRSQLHVALDVGYLDEARFHTLYDQADETGRVINGLRNAILRRKEQG